MLSSGIAVYIRENRVVAPRDRRLLVAAAARELGCPTSDITIGSACPHCGAPDHGAPIVSVRKTHGGADRVQGRAPHVSLSRCGDLVAVALVQSGLIGIDIESINRFATDRADDVLFHPAERIALSLLAESERSFHRAALWTAKESILKATGHGLVIDPELLLCTVTRGEVTLEEWPENLIVPGDLRVIIHRLSDDHLCAVTTSSQEPITFSWWPESLTMSS